MDLVSFPVLRFDSIIISLSHSLIYVIIIDWMILSETVKLDCLVCLNAA